MEQKVDFALLCQQLSALTEGVEYEVANLANTAALLWEMLPDINWVGFYKREADKLILGPFQGRPACIEIPVGKGVCGTAVAENRTVVVADVHAFAGHIACDSASRSEIVLPIRIGGKIWGVLDIDSPFENRFSPEDRVGLEQVAGCIEDFLG